MAKRHRRGKRQDASKSSRGNREARQADGSAAAKKWKVVVLAIARKEGHKILSDPQYDHIVDVLKRLVDFGNQEEIGDLRIESIGTFHELKEKGGILGRINLRVYFGVIPGESELVVTKVYKKEDDRQTPRHIIHLVEDRMEGYELGGRQKTDAIYQDTTSTE